MDFTTFAICVFTVAFMLAIHYTFTRRANARTLARVHEAELRIVTDGRRMAAERAGAIVTLEQQLAEARLAAATAEEQAGVARIYAMEAAESAAEGRITDPGEPPPISGNVYAFPQRVQ